MKNITLPLFISGLALLNTSCIYNDQDDSGENCDHYLNILSEDGIDSQIRDVVVYIYDANGLLLGYYHTTIATPINIEKYRDQGVIKVVVWGNAVGDLKPQTLSKPSIGSSISVHSLTQNQNGTSIGYIPLSDQSSDIFFGNLEINFNATKSENITSGNIQQLTTLYISRSVSSFAITIPNIGKAFDGPNADYKVVVRHPNKGLDFNNNLIDGETDYMPNTYYNAEKDILTTDINRILPTGSGSVIIEIYSNGKLVKIISVDSLGEPISLSANNLHNILINLNNYSDVKLISSKWGKIIIFGGFN